MFFNSVVFLPSHHFSEFICRGKKCLRLNRMLSLTSYSSRSSCLYTIPRSNNQLILVQPYRFVFSQIPPERNCEIEICVQEVYQGMPLESVPIWGEGNRIGHREELQYSCTRALANSVEPWS